MTYKRYMVFEFGQHAALGGTDDCEMSFDDKDEAFNYANTSVYKYVQVFDRIEGVSLEIDRASKIRYLKGKGIVLYFGGKNHPVTISFKTGQKDLMDDNLEFIKTITAEEWKG